jgi:SOS-response transcriptional repressor LexA
MHKLQKKILQLSEEQNLNAIGYRKLGALIGVDHPQKVKWHLQKLIRDGFLILSVDGELVKPTNQSEAAQTILLPILGRANCGEPLQFAGENHDENVQVSKSFLPAYKANNCFAVRAVGQSMNQASINGQPLTDGDLAIIDSTLEGPEDDEYILVSIDGLATIKKASIDRERQRLVLLAESSQNLNPIVLDADDHSAYTVHGRVIDVIPTAA